MSNGNLFPVVLAIAVVERLKDELAPKFEHALGDIQRLVQSFLAQPVTPEATAEFEKICSST